MPRISLHLTNDQLQLIQSASNSNKKGSLTTFVRMSALFAAQNPNAVPLKYDEYDALTTRELEVLKLVGEGKAPKEIAGILNVSARTVTVHIYNMMTKLDIHSRTALVLYALRRGVAQLPEAKNEMASLGNDERADRPASAYAAAV